MSLKSMTVSKLNDLKRQVESAIHAKVAERRREIESELSRLAEFSGGTRAKVVRAAASLMVVRKVGKKLGKSLIANGPKAPKPKQRTKTRKTRKAANNAPGHSNLASAEHIEALVEAIPVEVPIESLPIEPPATPIYGNVMADVSAAA
jgi:hypothetical protein